MGFDSENEFRVPVELGLEKNGPASNSSLSPGVKKVVNKPYECDYPDCDARFSRPWKLTAHRCLHTGERPYTCSEQGCGKSYTNPSHLRRHQMKSHAPTVADTNHEGDAAVHLSAFRCSEGGCDGRWFASDNALKKHHRIYHGDGKGKPNYVCAYCGKGFRKHSRLKGHHYYHDGTLSFRCTVCGLGFIQQYDLKRHMRGHKTWKCEEAECQTLEQFNKWSLFRAHIALKHTTGFKCVKCGKEFRVKSSMRSHASRDCCASEKQEVDEGAWECSVDGCGRQFTAQRKLSQHVRNRHEVKPRYQCTIEGCGKTFAWKCSLGKHIQLHMAKRPPRPKKKNRKRRKDAGVARRSTAELLSDCILRTQQQDHHTTTTTAQTELINE